MAKKTFLPQWVGKDMTLIDLGRLRTDWTARVIWEQLAISNGIEHTVTSNDIYLFDIKEIARFEALVDKMSKGNHYTIEYNKEAISG